MQDARKSDRACKLSSSADGSRTSTPESFQRLGTAQQRFKWWDLLTNPEEHGLMSARCLFYFSFGVSLCIAQCVYVCVYIYIFLVRSQYLGGVRRGRHVPAAVVHLDGGRLFLLLLLLLLLLLRDGVTDPQREQRERDHEEEAGDGAPGQDPAHGLDLGLGLAVERDADLVGYLLGLRVILQVSMLRPMT